MDMTNMLVNIGAGVIEARKRANVRGVTADDGMEYCAECGEPLQLALHFSGVMAEKLGNIRYVPRNCQCMRIMFAEEDEIRDKRKREDEIRQRRMNSLKSEIYREATFAKDDGRMPAIRKTCENYVEKRMDMIENNFGLAFIGGNGGGKTFFASCIANAMIDAGSTVYMDTLSNLIYDVTVDHGANRDAIMRKIRTVDLLILDDYGAERGTEFSLEQAFGIVDARYSVRKPLIITANITEDILKNPPNINYARSYSRILEMCPAIIRVEGERRTEIATEKRNALRKMLFEH